MEVCGRSKTIEAFGADLLALYATPARAPATRQRMVQVMSLLREFGIDRVEDLTAANLARWTSWRAESVKVNTLIGELGYVRAASRYAVAEELLARDPFASRRLRLRAEPTAGKTHHSLEEVRAVLELLRVRAGDWTGQRLYALFATVAFTGLRRNEALYLRVEDVDLVEGLIFVEPRGRSRLKTVASAAPVPIPPRLAEVLGVWVPMTGSDWLFPNGRKTGPWTGGNKGTKPLDRLKAAGLAAGVPGLTWQSLRHSWATHAETAWGISEGAIRRVLRHTTPMTSRRYRHPDAANLRAIGERVRYDGTAGQAARP